MNDNLIISLIQKIEAGTLSSEEQKHLTQWLAESSENQQLYDELKIVWEQTDGYKSDFQPDVDVAWSKVQDKIQAPAEAKVVQFNSRKWLSIAAAIAIVVTAGLFFMKNSGNQWEDIQLVANEVKEFKLSDGTMVYLQGPGSFSYPETFNGKERTVRLNGTGVFEVTKDAEHPFVVDAGSARVKVLGTEFEVKNTTDQVDVTVREGKVQLQPKGSSEKVILKAWQKGTFNSKAKELTKTAINDLSALAWQSSVLMFKDANFADMIKQIEAHYNIKMTLNSTVLINCKQTASFPSNDLDGILKTLKLTFNVDIQVQSKTEYSISGGRCK